MIGIDCKITKNDTLCLKGIAICGMLSWHLFFCSNPLGVEFSQIARFLGIIGDVCVSVFLFTSGYGLMQSWLRAGVNISESGGAILFILRRLIKFYFNFWFVFIIFVPIGILIFDIPIIQGEDILHKIKNIIFQVLAISDQQSYNTTWWFNSLIISLYILFPVIGYMINRLPIYSILVVLALGSTQLMIGPQLQRYLPVFVTGALWSAYNNELTAFLKRYRSSVLLSLLLFSIIINLIALFVLGDDHIHSRGLPCYLLLTLQLAMCTIFFIRNVSWLSKSISFLGKHSANIYLVHTFLNFYWFPKFFYSITNPLLLWMALLMSSVGISLGIEAIKNVIHWNDIPAHINSKLFKIENNYGNDSI